MIEEVLPLWPGPPPGGDRVTVVERTEPRVPNSPAGDIASVHVTCPTLWHFRAAQPTGAALLVVPGGGYRRVVTGFGVRAMCHWFAAHGVDVFVLRYRLPADRWAAGPRAPLQDARRALRLIHDRAGLWGIDRDRIGVLGLSAGGHLAAWLATDVAPAPDPADDAADAVLPRIACLGLLYPVVTMGDHAHPGSRHALLGASPTERDIADHSIERRVTAAMPPTFLATALDDALVDPVNTRLLYDALQAADVPVELHLFRRGGHGFTLQSHDGRPIAWAAPFLTWAAAP